MASTVPSSVVLGKRPRAAKPHTSGARFEGQIAVPRAGAWRFQLNSDDGAKLYIDGRLVIDNDGVHPPRKREGQIQLAAGRHDIVVEYFQGPRYEIALQLSWHDGRRWRVVPASAFTR